MSDLIYTPNAWNGLCYEIEKARAKAAAVESVRIEAAQIKQQMKEAADERKKQIGEQLIITAEGELQLQTTNLTVEAKPRNLTNMRKPELVALKHEEDRDEVIFCIGCKVGDDKKEIFLDGNMVGKSSYLLRKFLSKGVRFYTDAAKAKRIVVQLFCILQELSSTDITIPDEEAWIKKKDGCFEFIEKGELTWKKAMKMCQ